MRIGAVISLLLQSREVAFAKGEVFSFLNKCTYLSQDSNLDPFSSNFKSTRVNTGSTNFTYLENYWSSLSISVEVLE